MDQTNTYIVPGSNYVKNVFDDWNAMSIVTKQEAPIVPNGRKKRRKRWAPAATLNAVVLDWNNVVLSYTYQYGERWVLYRDEIPINLLPWGGTTPYSGSYTDVDCAPGVTYVYTIRRDDGDIVVLSRNATTWAHNFPEQYDMPESGDVKTSLRDADHSNWYLLNGRAISTLPLAAQAAAAALGYTTDLPDSTECCIRSAPVYLGEVTGTNSITLNRNQLPNISLSGTTNTTGQHTHVIHTVDNAGVWDNYVAQGYNPDLNAGRETSAAGDHSHTVTTESLNGDVVQQVIDLTPKSFNVNLFIWLL
jgi:hypothetical protein